MSIVEMDCSQDHVVVISDTGLAYSWGSNSFGKLGIKCKSNEIIRTPTLIRIVVKVKKVFCGLDSTAFVDEFGTAWACGNNCFNKLGLNRTSSYLTTKTVSFSNVPINVQLGKSKVEHISLGTDHTLFLLESGTFMFAGCNRNGEAGLCHVDIVTRPIKNEIFKHQSVKVSYTN